MSVPDHAPADEVYLVLEQLAQTYRGMESLLQQYLAQLSEGWLANELLTALHDQVMHSAELLTTLQKLSSTSSERDSQTFSHRAEKKQQVLEILGRVLQCLAQTEAQVQTFAAALTPHSAALVQACSMRQAYQLALATCQEARTASLEFCFPETLPNELPPQSEPATSAGSERKPDNC
ncbi:MAG: hypothetical protein NZM42_01670 [Gemmatales bacterium]|nr:hypothetical protein [Gemmatales bacterium]MDW8221417.1 hypothetical protein [Gemmatales bacterium]